MREKIKRILAILLVIGFSFTSIPTSLVSYASGETPEEFPSYEEEYEAEILEDETEAEAESESEAVLVTYFENDQDDMHVTAQLNEADGLPEGTTFVIRQVYEDSHDEADRGIYHWADGVLNATLAENGVIPIQSFYYDLYFEYNGERMSPEKPFQVQITWKTDQSLEPGATGDHVRVYRIIDEGATEHQKAVDTNAQVELTAWGTLGTAKFTIEHSQHSPLMIALIETTAERDARIAAEEESKAAEEASLAAEEAARQAEEESRLAQEAAQQTEKNISIITNEDDVDTRPEDQLVVSDVSDEEGQESNLIITDEKQNQIEELEAGSDNSQESGQNIGDESENNQEGYVEDTSEGTPGEDQTNASDKSKESEEIDETEETSEENKTFIIMNEGRESESADVSAEDEEESGEAIEAVDGEGEDEQGSRKFITDEIVEPETPEEGEKQKSADQEGTEEEAENQEDTESEDTEEAGKEDVEKEAADGTEEQVDSEEEKESEEETKEADDKEKEEDEKDEAEQEEVRTRSYYTSWGSDVNITVTLSNPAQVPDDAQVVVTKVTPEAGDYNYDAYIQALNDASDGSITYNADNTLLYDISFIKDVYNEEGELIDHIVYEPEAGSVKVTLRFNHNQLSDEIKAENPEEVTVNHLITDDAADTTAITAGEIAVETVAADVNLQGLDTVKFDTESFSVYAFTYTVDFSYTDEEGQEHTWQFPGTGSHNLKEVLAELGIQGEVISDASLELKELVDEETEGALYLTQENGEWWINSDAAFDDTYDLKLTVDNASISIIVTDAQQEGTDYLVEIHFKDESGQSCPPDLGNSTYEVYAAVYRDISEGKQCAYYDKKAISKTSDQTLTFTGFSRTNPKAGDPQTVKYLPEENISIVFGKDFNIEQNNLPRGTIHSVNEIENGSVAFGYYFTITQETRKTVITGTKLGDYDYEIRAVKSDGTTAISGAPDFNGQDWYLYVSVGRNDGTYIYTERISNKFINASCSGRISALFNKNDKNNVANARTTKIMPGDNLSISLIRPKDGGNHDWAYFSTTDNINTNSMSNMSVECKYTLFVDTSADNKAVLTLQEAAPVSITVKAHADGSESSSVVSPNLNAPGKYFVLGQMFVNDGIKRYYGYYLDELNNSANNQTVNITQGFKAYPEASSNNFNYNYNQYVTGARSFKTGLVYFDDSNVTADDALDFLVGKQTGKTFIIYNDGAVVEQYRLTSEEGSMNNLNPIIHLTRLPNLTISGEVQNAAGEIAQEYKDSQARYYVLLKLTQDGQISYALKPLDQAVSTTASEVEYFEDLAGRKFYYHPADTLDFYIIKTNATDNLNLTAAINETIGTRYKAGQLMGTYVANIEKTDYNIKAILTEQQTSEGASHTVSVKMLQKDKVTASDSSTINNALTKTYYYVAAYLTPKGSGASGTVVGWSILDIDKSDLAADGSWTGTLSADAFQICDSSLKATGRTMSYNADQYDLNLRMYGNDGTKYTTISDLRTYASDESPNGYDFMGVHSEESGTASTIELHEAYQKEYGIKVKVDTAGLSVREDEAYYVWAKVYHQSGGFAHNALAKLVLDGTETEKVLEFYGENGKYWRDGNSNLEDYSFTGNEKKIELYIIKAKQSGFNLSQSGHYLLLEEGNSINAYTWTPGTREQKDVETNGQYATVIYDIVNFTKDVNGISKGTIDGYLTTATDFGLYTLDFAEDSADMESNIAAYVLSAGSIVDYGYSGNNEKVHSISVVKTYFENGTPASGKTVKIRLYKDNVQIAEKTGLTDANGSLQLAFGELEAGIYEIREVVNNVEVPYGETGVTNVGNVKVSIADRNIELENDVNTNINYFGSIVNSIYGTILEKSRHGLIIAGNESDYQKLIKANGNREDSSTASVRYAQNYPTKYDLPGDFVSLRDLSGLLGSSSSSETVRIENISADKFNEESWRQQLRDDGRYIVLNIDATGKDYFEMQSALWLNGQQLHADFGHGGKEDSSKVLFNIIERDAAGNIVPYSGTLKSAKEGSGVLLAPSAVVYGATGNWGGSIIAKEYHHVTGEIHSENSNKILNKNTTIINETGTAPEKGSLKLQKSFLGTSNDRTTYFTFLVRFTDTNGSPLLPGTTFTASGLKNGNVITLDNNGSATIQVRAQNSVTIVGIPAGTRYAVEELTAAATSHFALDHIKGGQGTITADKMAIANVVNKLNNSVGVNFNAQKVLYNDTLTDGQFVFELSEYTDENFNTKKSEGVEQTKTNTSSGTVSFDKITYEAGGTYYYLLKETLPEGTSVNGSLTRSDGSVMHYDTTEYKYRVDVEISESGDVSLKKTRISPSDVQESDAVTFVNWVEKNTEVNVRKEWGEGIKSSDYEVIVKLHRYTNGASTEDSVEVFSAASIGNQDIEQVLKNGSWEFTWKNLPTAKKNADGSIDTYRYDVTEEGVYLASDTTRSNNLKNQFISEIKKNNDGSFTVTNREIPKISFTVTKEWVENGTLVYSTVDTPRSITFSITQNGQSFDLTGVDVKNTNHKGSFNVSGNNITLTAGSDGWPVVEFKNVEDATYVITETSYTPNDANLKTTTTYVVAANGEREATQTISEDQSDMVIRNSSTLGEQTSITVDKKWFNGDTEEQGQNGSISFDLYRTLENIGGDIQLNSLNTNSNGNVDSSTITVHFGGDFPPSGIDSVVCYPGDVLMFSVEVPSTLSPTDFGWMTGYIFNGSIKANGKDISNKWKYHSTDRKQDFSIDVTSSMTSLEFYSWDNSNLQFTYLGKENSVESGNANIVHGLTAVFEPQLTSRAELIDFIRNNDLSPVATDFILSNETGWSKTIDSLDKYADLEETQEWHYFVVENVPSGYEDSYVIDGNHITIKNTKHEDDGKLTINKQVVRGTDPENTSGTFKFGVYDNSQGTGTRYGSGEITLNEASSGSVTISNLTYGTYYVFELDDQNQPITEETGTIGGIVFSVNGSGTQITVNGATGGNAADVTVTNTLPDLGALEITKRVQKNGVTDSSAIGTFYYAVYDEEYKADSDSKPEPIRTGKIELTETDKGTKTVTENDLPYATYYVYELDGPSGNPIISGTDGAVTKIGETVYKVSGSGTIAVVNKEQNQNSTSNKVTLTNNYETVEFSVNKVWLNGNNNTAPVNATVTVALFKKSVSEDISITGSSITLDGVADNGQNSTAFEKTAWTAFWTDLPKYEDDGTEIVYIARESSTLTGYKVAYQNDTNDQVKDYALNNETITNIELTQITVIKKWILNGKEIAGPDDLTEIKFDLWQVKGDGLSPAVKYSDSTYSIIKKVIGEGEDALITWETTIERLPKYYLDDNKDWKEFQYYVEEDTKDLAGWSLLSYSFGDSDTETTMMGSEKRLNNGNIVITNSKSVTALPSTGGVGTTFFYLLGGILILGAGSALLIHGQKHRKKNQN